MARKQMRKFSEGDEVDPLEAANASKESQDIANDAIFGGVMQKFHDENRAAEAAPKKQSFSEAFASARKGGEKTFEWNGKKYGTELAKPAPKKAAEPAASAPAPKAAAPKVAESAPAPKAPLRAETMQDRAERYVAKRAAQREADRAEAERRQSPGRGRIDTSNIDSKTLLPKKGMKTGGSVRGWGIARSARKAKIV
jgi:hypothetical protein